MKYYVGIDLGGTNIVAGVVDAVAFHHFLRCDLPLVVVGVLVGQEFDLDASKIFLFKGKLAF